MTGRQLTAFEQILLGLISTTPSSGYDLKRVFASTPMGVYQPSSGSLYPALRRLEAQGLISATGSPGHVDHTARHRRVYEATETGLEAHLSWLRAPVAPETVARDLGLHLMRFVMMERQLPRAEVLSFLHDLAAVLEDFTTQLEHYAKVAEHMDQYPRLALDHGLEVHRASLRWVEHAVETLASGTGPDTDTGRDTGTGVP
jgi:DNA-binding PadR family transcriptional regulator